MLEKFYFAFSVISNRDFEKFLKITSESFSKTADWHSFRLVFK